MSPIDKTVRSQTETISFELDLHHSPAKVWRAVTDPALLTEWLLPVIDLKLEPGAAFTFKTQPFPGWDGVVSCRILEIEAQKKLSYTWVVGDMELDTVVTFTLTPTESGTRLSLVQSGFKPHQKQNFGGARYGWKMMGGKLVDVLARMPELTLRRATLRDVPVLERWDREPHVIAATTDDSDAEKAFGDHDWSVEIPKQSEVSEFLIAELDGRPIGAMQIIDPHEEPTHYWGEIDPNLRAIDIWIGDAADHGKGHGETMMRLAFQRCFADPTVTAILIDPLASNTRAHKFYQRIGFVAVGRQVFGDDDCLVHRLSREAWRARFPGD